MTVKSPKFSGENGTSQNPESSVIVLVWRLVTIAVGSNWYCCVNFSIYSGEFEIRTEWNVRG